ncbi:hypothetical protein ABT369_16950 [Dactylosporangium sp. NPDC000244]|uniref:hypothetical protein n=1 Tax=Dactylosporangium sp. NPDC000244 TaxID=3154365 RepID=UPI00332052B0
MRQAFGSRFRRLHDLGEGWQRVNVLPFYRERPRFSAGIQELAAASGAPALAAYVSESWCAHIEARTPQGVAISAHLPNIQDACPYQHREGQPEPFAPHLVVEAFEAWATEAARSPDPATVAAIVGGAWNDRPFMEGRVLALIAALGFPPGTEIPPLFDPDDNAFWQSRQFTFLADARAANLVSIAERGELPEPGWDLSPRDIDYLRFSETLEASLYGEGLSRDQLIAQRAQLASRWPAEPPPSLDELRRQRAEARKTDS